MGIYKSQNVIKFPINSYIWKVKHARTQALSLLLTPTLASQLIAELAHPLPHKRGESYSLYFECQKAKGSPVHRQSLELGTALTSFVGGYA